MIRACRDERFEGNRGEIETTSVACDMIHWGTPGERAFLPLDFRVHL